MCAGGGAQQKPTSHGMLNGMAGKAQRQVQLPHASSAPPAVAASLASGAASLAAVRPILPRPFLTALALIMAHLPVCLVEFAHCSSVCRHYRSSRYLPLQPLFQHPCTPSQGR